LAILPPLAALVVQWSLWPIVRPSIWFLLYPAIFFSSWLGGLRISLVATVISALVVLWAFVPPQYTFIVPLGQYLAAATFIGTGVAFGLFHDRLRRANRRAVDTLAASERANEALRRARDDAEAARRELQRTNQALASLVEQAPDGIFVADLSGRYTDVNGAGCRLLGYRREEIIGKTIVDLIPAEDVERLEREKHRLIEGQTVVSEWKVRRADGSYLPVEVSAAILPDGRWQGVVRDIRDRKRAEEERRLGEAKASGIVAVSADAIISVDDRQRITLFNAGAERIFGYSRAEAIGAPLDMLIPERFRAAHRRDVERFADSDEEARPMSKREAAIFGLRKSGEEFPAEAAISRLRIDGTTILTVALRDVTDRRRFETEQALLWEMGSVLASTLELGPTLTSIGRLMTRSLADACIVYAMEEDRERLRRDVALREPGQDWIREALARLPVGRSHAPDIWAELEANRSVLIPEVSPEMRESFAETEEDRRALRALDTRSVIVTPLYAHGRLVGAVTLLSCSRTRVYGPADVRFAEQVAQRAALAIDNAQLYGAARRAIQSRDDVLGVVAHDLRNPLGAVLVQSGLLRRVAQDPAGRITRAADSIGRSANRMNRLIQDLLDVTRLEEGRLSVYQSHLPVGPVLADAVAAQEALAIAASLDLEIDAPEDLPEVWADRDRLLQILENLIANAIKFTGAGGIVRVGAAPRAGEVLFWVEDTGTGIAGEDLPRVFDRFWQATKSDRRGAGLGLPIVKGLVEAHGGHVWVESRIDHGSTFFFTIPTAPQPAAAAPL
jgi:PAS domain S-box-containing protein